MAPACLTAISSAAELGPPWLNLSIRRGAAAPATVRPRGANLPTLAASPAEAPNLPAAFSAPSFGNEGDNSFAQSFLEKYRDGVVRGFIAPEDEVRPENLDRIISQDAYAASMERSPNTAGKFPGANGVNV